MSPGGVIGVQRGPRRLTQCLSVAGEAKRLHQLCLHEAVLAANILTVLELARIVGMALEMLQHVAFPLIRQDPFGSSLLEADASDLPARAFTEIVGAMSEQTRTACAGPPDCNAPFNRGLSRDANSTASCLAPCSISAACAGVLPAPPTPSKPIRMTRLRSLAFSPVGERPTFIGRHLAF